MTDILLMGGGAGVVLLVICLIVREQTESRIRGLSTELISLRSNERRLADKRDEIEKMESQMHEAMMRQASEDVKPNHIVSVLQVGYKMGDLVLRPAKVAIAELKEEGE